MTVTLITGANKGLGYETARQLIKHGHTVYIGARDVERGEAAASELGGRFVQLDVTDDASVRPLSVSIAEREGHLDVLVNNAGVSSAARGRRPGGAAGVRHQRHRCHPCHPGRAAAAGEVRQPGRGQRLQRPRVVLGRHQS